MNYNNINFFKNYDKFSEEELENIVSICDPHSLAKNFHLGVERLEKLKDLKRLSMPFTSLLKEHITNVRLEEDIITYCLKYLDIDTLLDSLDSGVNYNVHSEDFIQKLKLVAKLKK